jgi:hypothetical protein
MRPVASSAHFDSAISGKRYRADCRSDETGALIKPVPADSLSDECCDEGAGDVIVLFVWNRLVVHHVISDPAATADAGAPPPRRLP